LRNPHHGQVRLWSLGRCDPFEDPNIEVRERCGRYRFSTDFYELGFDFPPAGDRLTNQLWTLDDECAFVLTRTTTPYQAP
jgi:hypothetical protein